MKAYLRQKRASEILLVVACVSVLSALTFTACKITSEPETEVVEIPTETEVAVRGTPDEEFLAEQPEQKYIVRYAHIYNTTDDGVVYEDDNGNLWNVADPPEINGEVRLLFDSNETMTAKDDVIIDITEAK